MLGGSLGAGRDAAAISLASSMMGVTAGRDAFVWTFDKYHSNVTAGQDAFVLSLGGVFAGVTAGRDGGMYAVDYAIERVPGTQYLTLAHLGTHYQLLKETALSNYPYVQYVQEGRNRFYPTF